MLLFLLLGIAVEYLDRTGADGLRAALRPVSFARSQVNFARSVLLADELPELRIDLKHTHHSKLAAKREEAIARGVLIGSDSDWVPAKIEIDDGQRADVKVRLKGDLGDHWKGRKWSLRIHTKGDDQLFGMCRFSIQHPGTRGFLSTWAFYEHLRSEGVLAPRYRFVQVLVNGDPKGIFALEEHMAKELVEFQERREGPIVSFDEGPFWAQRAVAFREGLWGELDQLDYRTAAIDAFEGGRADEDPVFRATLSAAQGLLDGFREGRLPASRAFDVDLLARWLAISRLWAGEHGFDWLNLRFYYNPLTTLLEPIGFDANPGRGDEERDLALFGSPNPARLTAHWVAMLLDDELVLRAYADELHRVSRPEYVERLEGELGVRLRARTLQLQREWPLLSDPLEPVRARRAVIAERLNPVTALAARIPEAGSGALEAANVGGAPLEVLGVEIDGEFTESGPPLLLRERERGVVARWVRLLERPGWPVGGAVRVRYRTLGAHELRTVDAGAALPDPQHGGAPQPSEDGPSLAASLEYLEWSEAEDTLRLLPGDWPVRGDLVLPEGIPLVAPPGVTLRMESGAVLLARGPLLWRGTAERPVRVVSERESFGGIVVLSAGGTSEWEHVEVTGTGGIERGAWTLTGGVTFFESPVVLADSRIADCHCEDALNVFRSRFEMLRCRIESTVSDGFDGDFVQGRVVDSTFTRIGGDGVDVSGSSIEVVGLTAVDVADKAVSAGEQSTADVRGLLVDGASIAVASKDLSEVRVEGGAARSVGIGLAAYTKKPTYGPARIEARGFDLAGADRPVLVQTGSTVSTNGEEHRGVELAVKELYATGILGN